MSAYGLALMISIGSLVILSFFYWLMPGVFAILKGEDEK